MWIRLAWALIFLPSVLFAEGIDLQKLQASETVQHVLYETYLKTHKGPAGVLGYYFDRYFSQNAYTSLAIFGAVTGDRGGYGVAAVGLGYRIPFSERLSLNLRALVGSGGGGGVPAGGGFMVETLGTFQYMFEKNLFIDIGYGEIAFPTGSLTSPILQIGIAYRTRTLSLPF